MKHLIRKIDECTFLYRDHETGIAWVENGHTGSGHSAHPNIDQTGSVKGMKKLGYWNQEDKCVRCHGIIYNISQYSVTDDLDYMAGRHCRCGGNHGESRIPYRESVEHYQKLADETEPGHSPYSGSIEFWKRQSYNELAAHYNKLADEEDARKSNNGKVNDD